MKENLTIKELKKLIETAPDDYVVVTSDFDREIGEYRQAVNDLWLNTDDKMLVISLRRLV